MINLLSEKNLQAGIRIWHQTTWPPDFHNQFYKDLHRRREHGLDEEWWLATVDDLCKWKAIRPLPKGEVLARGQKRLQDLRREYARMQSIPGNQMANLSNLSWEDVADLYQVAYEIKNVNAPVFGSKLCHFIMPDAFPVIDGRIIKKIRKVIGVNNPSYKDYWQFCKAQWVGCTAQSQLVAMMQKEIEKIGRNVFIHYPYATKITELCISGS